MSEKTTPLAPDIHFRALRLLAQNPDISQREMAKELGISLGKANYCLKALVEKGQLKIHNFRTSDSKHRYAYVLTPAGFARKAALTSRFLQIKIEEYEMLRAEIKSLQRDIEGKLESTR